MDYHSHPALSRSAVVCFRESRRLYHGRHVLRLPEAQVEPTPAMNLGTLTHAELLEPGSLEGKYSVLTEWPDFKTKAAREWRDAETTRGQIVVKPGEVAAMLAMVRSAVAMLKTIGVRESIVEQPIFWTDDETGLKCRCKPDLLVDTTNFVCVPDIKTTADASPSAFAKQVANMSLWLQDIHYTEGVRKQYGKPVQFMFLVVEKSYPYRAGLYQLHDTRQAEAEYYDTLAAIKACQESGDYSEPWEKNINPVHVKDGAFKCDSMEVV